MSAAASNLVANFLPVRFLRSEFRAGVSAYESRDQLARLRTELRGTHLVARDHARVVCVPLAADVAEIGNQETLVIRDNQYVAMRLVLAALVAKVLTLGCKLCSFRPPQFVMRYARRDLLAECAGDQRDVLAGLHVYPRYSLDARVSGPAYKPGVIVGLSTRYEIDLTAAELLARGLSLDGRYVRAETGEVPGDPDLEEQAYRMLAGAVESVRDGRLYLRDAPKLTEVAADRAWLESGRGNFKDVISHLTGGRQERLLGQLAEAVFRLAGGEGRLDRINALAGWLAGEGPLQVADGIEVEIKPPVGSKTGLRPTRFDEPTFVFDPGGDKSSRSAAKGLAEFGPFDSQFFTPRRPRIAVLTPRAFQGTVEEFMNAFRRGVPEGGVFTQGFARKYRLSDCDVIVEAFDAAGPCDAAAYREACLTAVQRSDKPGLAIVVTSEAQQELQGNASPYLVAKSTLMGQGVAVQEVQVETIRKGNIAYPLDSMALQCYAKLGGIPYVIAAVGPIARELVIGIGSAHINHSRFGSPQRFVGITSVFSADGNYLLSNTSREAEYDRYPEELLRALRDCIQEIKQRNGWQPDDAIRLIFHIFKPFKDAEADAVKSLVDELLAEFRTVEYAFLHVSQAHEWHLFDTAASGVGNHRMPSGRRQPKGRHVPRRGHAVPVSRTEVLLTVSGPYDLKRPTDGQPQPLLLKLHRASTFTDIEYLAGQVFRFTALSWRRLHPSGTPVTILYSDLIASLLSRLRQVSNWNADVLRTSFSTSRWFL